MCCRATETRTAAVDLAPVPEAALEPADEEEPERHERSAREQERAPAPAVDVDDRGDGHGDVEYVLHRVGNEVRTAPREACALEHIDDVVPAWRQRPACGERRATHIITFIPHNCDHIWSDMPSATRRAMPGLTRSA